MVFADRGLMLAGPASGLAQEPVGPGVRLRTGRATLPVLDSEDCIRIALQDSPTLMMSRNEQRHIASQDVTGAWGQFLPTISLGYNWNKSERRTSTRQFTGRSIP